MPGLEVNDPVSLKIALSSTRVIPGDVILLAPGTYIADEAGLISGTSAAGKGVFRVLVQGTQARPITIKAATPGTVTINGGLELINSPYITVQDLTIAPTMTDRAVVDYPNGVYISSLGCRLIHNSVIGGTESVALFGTGGAEIYGNYFNDWGWNDGVKGRGTFYTHNHPGGTITIRHNIFGSGMGQFALEMWSAGINNILDYNVTENAFVGQGVMMASHEGTVSRNTLKDNHIARDVRIGEANQAGEQDKLIEGNRIYCDDWHVLALYYQTQATIRNNKFIFPVSNDGMINYFGTAPGNVWEGNQYYNPQHGIFYKTDHADMTWAEWVAFSGETGTEYDTLPADETITYPDLYTPGMSLECAWTYGENPALTATRVQA